ncbi:sialin-like [Scaptodrosophila lebanonensis]|uniref:Sialin-like n=1 Tax=Drosophila lebanonensis TaxID=7225 RepID=A0A6J2U5G5_DROLE|nr:sialin-like [Scaptodrosophila lebanonensis]
MGDVPAKGSLLGNCFPARYQFAVLGSIAMAIIYGLKVNLSVTMVAMLNHTALAISQASNETDPKEDEAECKPPPGTSTDAKKVEDGPFDWSEPLQGILLSCYFWGYLVSQIPLAHVAENISAKWVVFFSVAINVVCTILTPILTKLHYGGLIAMRLLEGIGGGASFPGMHVMIAAWAPINERMVISTITYVGTSVGTALSILMSGVIAVKFGWEWVFYVMGGLSCIWMILWIFMVQDNPNKQRFISEQERELINDSLGTTGDEEHPPVPWRKVFTSCPFWAIVVAHVCSNCGWYMFLIEIPFYMKQVLKFNVANNAVLSALPYVPFFFFSIFIGKLLVVLVTKGKLTTTCARKIATSIASVIPSICLIILCFIGCRHYEAVGVMSVGIVAMGAMFSGFLSNHIDIAPNFAGTLMALTNTLATLPGIIVPLYVGYVTKGNQTIGAWRLIFAPTIVLLLVEFVSYLIFGTAKEQPWNNAAAKTS